MREIRTVAEAFRSAQCVSVADSREEAEDYFIDCLANDLTMMNSNGGATILKSSTMIEENGRKSHRFFIVTRAGSVGSFSIILLSSHIFLPDAVSRSKFVRA